MSREEIQNDALKAIEDCNRCGIAVSMGVGKTLIGLQHIFQNYDDTLKVLVVAPKRSILKSWVDEAGKFNLNHLLDHITFSTYISLTKQTDDYDIIYLDECHNLLFTHDAWLSNYKGRIVGLTGTPPKIASSEKGMMVNKYCPITYKYITDDAINDGILNDYQIIVHKLKLDDRKNFMQKTRSGQFPTSELSSYNYWSERLLNANGAKDIQITRVMRMKALMSFPSKERYASKLFETIEDKVILFANTQDQADKMCPHSYHSTNTDSEVNLQKFKSGDISKLSCVLQLNEGVNIPNLKQGIIMHAYGNERKSAQRLGRLLRLNPDEKAIIHILCYSGTVDETWVIQALEQYDNSKITWIENGQLQFASWSRA
jgi:superfamily II DNA or RNA helicase